MEGVIADMMSRRAALMAHGAMPSFLGTIGVLVISLLLNLGIIGIFSAPLLWKPCHSSNQPHTPACERKEQWGHTFQPQMAEWLSNGKVWAVFLSRQSCSFNTSSFTIQRWGCWCVVLSAEAFFKPRFTSVVVVHVFTQKLKTRLHLSKPFSVQLIYFEGSSRCI